MVGGGSASVAFDLAGDLRLQVPRINSTSIWSREGPFLEHLRFVSVSQLCVVIVILISVRLPGVCVSHKCGSGNPPFWHDGTWYR